MKKTLVALAAFAAASSYAGVTIDGLFDAGYQSNTIQGVRVSGMEGNGAGTSQINFRGTEDLGGGLSANFHLESDFSTMNNQANTGSVAGYNSTGGTQLNTGNAASFGNGEISTGLAGGFGQVRFGAVNNAGLEYVAMISPDFGTAMGGGYKSTLAADTTHSVVRWGNSVRYDTPMFSGFQASVIVANKQTMAQTTQQTPTGGTAGILANSTSMGYFNVAGATELSARYINGPLKVLAVNSTTQQTSGTNDTQRDLGASYALSDALSLQAGIQNTTLASATTPYSTSAKSVASVYTIGQHKFAGTYTSFTSTAANTATANELGLGYDYMLSKTTKLYAHYAHLNDSTAATWAANPAVYLANATSGQRTYTKSAFGVQVNF